MDSLMVELTRPGKHFLLVFVVVPVGTAGEGTPAEGRAAAETAVEGTPAVGSLAADSPAVAGSPAAGSPAAGNPAVGSPAADSLQAPAIRVRNKVTGCTHTVLPDNRWLDSIGRRANQPTPTIWTDATCLVEHSFALCIL